MERLRGVGRRYDSAEEAAARQAEALLAAAGFPAPPVMDAVLAVLPEVAVRRWRGLPQPVLLLPNGRHWLILVDADLDEAEQSLHILHQIKHILDAPDQATSSFGGAPVRTLHCDRFAMNVLVPSDRLRHDLANRRSGVDGLARHYGVPVAALRQHIRELGPMEGGKA